MISVCLAVILPLPSHSLLVFHTLSRPVDAYERCVKAKHATRTKRAGVTFYNKECEIHLKKYLASQKDHNPKLFRIGYRQSNQIWKKASQVADIKIRPQVLRKWHSTVLGELMVPDRFVDIFQGRTPKSVLAKHYTGKGLERLKRIYDNAHLKVIC